jgi:hypothetical protein
VRLADPDSRPDVPPREPFARQSAARRTDADRASPASGLGAARGRSAASGPSGIARSQLDAYRSSENPNRLRIDGAAVTLPADLATPFGLMLHELATNAAKYGSLSRPGGGVALHWSLSTVKGQPALTVMWKESGGPPVSPPKTAGFGGALIDGGLPRAVVHREFRPDGLVCTMQIPLERTSPDEMAGQI